MSNVVSKLLNPAFLDKLVDQFAAWCLTSGIRIILIIIGGFLVLKFFYIIIGRIEKLIAGREREVIAAIETEKRLATLGNLMRKAALVAVVLTSLMMILKEVGMDIAPIIAGAGIVGLAVGFGAQNLVRDIISGFFMILENQIRVGDVGEINGTGGLVEEINLRTIVIRDLGGVVHIFPNGTINTLSNMSKGWSRYVVDVGVAYKENVDDVMKVLGEIGEGLSNDQHFGPFILEPLQILGVDDFGDSQVTIKCMIKTLPLKQWEVGRELRRRIKNIFDEKGIEIPFPHLSVYFGEASKPFNVNANTTDTSKAA
jgi:small-conductance mechanosensitive channel